MSSDNHSGENPNTGFTVPFMCFVYAGVLVLTYFFGWVVLAVFAVLWAAAMVFACFDDKRQGNTSVDPDAPLSAAADNLDEFCDAQRLCLTCGCSVFSVEPGVTTAEQISQFAVSAEGWQENPEAVAGWMPPGLYCPKGCFNIHATPIPGFSPEPGHPAQ